MSMDKKGNNPLLIFPFNLILNPHLWVLVIMLVSITYAYYLAMFPYANGFNFLNAIAIFEFQNHLNGSLYTIPVIYAALVFPWEGPLIVWLAAMALILARLLYMTLSPETTIINLIIACIPLVAFISIKLEIRRQQREKLALKQRQKERQSYLNLIIRAQEDERKRIARELHDNIIQTLLIEVSHIRDLPSSDSDQLQEKTDEIGKTLLDLSDELRRVTFDLMPGVLDNLGLVPAIKWLSEQVSKDSNINIEINTRGKIYRYNNDQEIHIFRIIQEALNNIRKHSDANLVRINIMTHPDYLTVSIHDNGKGFALPQNFGVLSLQGKSGLIGIYQRARSINYNVIMQSNPGQGFQIKLYPHGHETPVY